MTLPPNKNVSGTIGGQAIFPQIEIRWEYALCTEKVHGMGLKPLVIIFFNPLAEARGNGWICRYREQFWWTA